jgi:hypothetical protein
MRQAVAGHAEALAKAGDPLPKSQHRNEISF